MMRKDIRTIMVAGTKVGMLGLDEIFAELKAAGREPSTKLAEDLVTLAGRLNYIAPSVTEDYAKALLREYRQFLGEDVKEESPMLSIKVLGPGCHRCETLMSNVRSALAELGCAADVEHVHDIAQITEYGVLGTPALVIDGKVRSVGKALSKEQVKTLLRQI